MSSSQFRPHGDYEVERVGKLLVGTVHGGWNLEQARRARALNAPLVQELAATGGPWAVLVLYQDTLVAPKAVLQEVLVGLEAARALGLRALALVADPQVEGAGFLAGPYQAQAQSVLPSALFATRAEAEEWLTPWLAAPA